ncbi:MAG: hypothetical protein JO243_07825, partial [Solirubrobacterales bacterium]|nr:hypothetical protein [Solirubrobacterales bacterium]
GHGGAGSYVAGLHHALLVGVAVALAGAFVTAVLIGRAARKPSASFHVAEAAADTV